jgi:hypothetical protein
MTLEALHARIASLADQLDEQHTVIAAGHPKDQDGFPQVSNPDLADALHAMSDAVSALSRLAYKLSQDGVQQ